MNRTIPASLCLLFVVSLAPASFAQAPPAAQPTPAPSAAPAPAASAPVPPAPATTTAPAPAPAPAQCFPACRDGYLCDRGACISACNPPCPAGQACAGSGQCVSTQVAAPAPAPAPGGAYGATGPADAGWARGAAVFGYISGAVILGGTAGVVALNDSSTDDDARTLGIVTTLYLAASAPVVAVGGGSAREHPAVKGNSALRIVSWIGYGLTLVDAAFLVGVSFESEVSNAHILSVGVLGALSTVGLALDAHISASQADAVRMAEQPRAALTLAPAFGLTRPANPLTSAGRVPWAGVGGTF
jgi:hypothetical protein